MSERGRMPRESNHARRETSWRVGHRTAVWLAVAAAHAGLAVTGQWVAWVLPGRPGHGYTVHARPFPQPEPERRAASERRRADPERAARTPPSWTPRAEPERRAVARTARAVVAAPMEARRATSSAVQVTEVALSSVAADGAEAPGFPGSDADGAANGEAPDREPRPLPGCRPPAYPERARALGITGTVELRVQLSADGAVLDVAVARSSGSRLLDRAALDAVRAWRFLPRLRAGRAVPCEILQPVAFGLR